MGAEDFKVDGDDTPSQSWQQRQLRRAHVVHSAVGKLIDAKEKVRFCEHGDPDCDQDHEDPVNWAGPMPPDVLNQCTVNRKIVEAFHEVRREAPTAFWMLGFFNALRILTMIPLMILWTLAFWWGQALWSRLQGTGYRQTYQGQV